MTRIDLISTALVWGLIFWHLTRTTLRQMGSEQWQFNRGLLWGLLISAGGVFTFRVYEVQREFESLLGVDTPVGLWMRSISTIGAIWSYTLLLRQVSQKSHFVTPSATNAAYPALLFVPPISLLLTVMLLSSSIAGLLDYARSYYLTLLAVDVAVLVLISFIFVPLNVAMYRFEQVRNMRLKHSATILLCVCYTGSVLVTLKHNLGIINSGVMALPVSFSWLALIAAICVIIQFSPFKALSALFVPLDYLKYLKLSHVERRVARMANARPISQRTTNPFQLEQAMYAAFISILDNHTDLAENDEGRRLRRQIEQYIREYPDYLDLVDKLMSLRA